MEHSIFDSPSLELIDLMKQNLSNNKMNYLLPFIHMSQESSRFGSVINEYFNKRIKIKTKYKTLFTNSHLESIYGVIKIIRHNNWIKTRDSKGRIIIFDQKNKINLFFNPLKKSEKDALIPNIIIESNIQNLYEKFVAYPDLIGLIFRFTPDIENDVVERIFAVCKEKQILTAFDESPTYNWYTTQKKLYSFTTPPDIFIMGENLINHQIPFGTFSMSDAIYQPWNSIGSCMLHTSTYSGNTLPLRFILNKFSQYHLIPEYTGVKVSQKATYKNFVDYINPKQAVICKSLRLFPNVIKAKGIKLTVSIGKYEREIIDCVGSCGCSLRGHNPDDVKNVLDEHHPSDDYWSRLSEKLSLLTHLPHAFPAVSGNSAVDIAVTIGMLAAVPKSRIIIFTNNYSGRSLIALSVTGVEPIKLPFGPFYHNVVTLNPFEENAKERLRHEIFSNQIGLIWFEIIQGEQLDKIPLDILETIEEHRQLFGYLVGVDEVLTGSFRTGKFLCSQDKISLPDIITLSKALSDMTFPIATTLVSDKVYRLASHQNRDLVEQLKHFYKNQMGSHVALNSLETAISQKLGDHVKSMGSLLKAQLEKIKEKVSFIKEIRGEGLLLYIKTNKNKFPINIIGEHQFAFFLSNYLMRSANVLTIYGLLTPPLSITSDEVYDLSQRLSNALVGKSAFSISLEGLVRVLWTNCLLYFRSLMRNK